MAGKHHYNDVTWSLWHIRSLPTWLFVQQLIQLIQKISPLQAFVKRIHWVASRPPSQMVSNVKIISMSWHLHSGGQTQTERNNTADSVISKTTWINSPIYSFRTDDRNMHHWIVSVDSLIHVLLEAINWTVCWINVNWAILQYMWSENKKNCLKKMIFKVLTAEFQPFWFSPLPSRLMSAAVKFCLG